MIVGIGTDFIEVSRVLRACERKHFLEKLYTERERELLCKDIRKAAGNFAAKEAVSKVFGSGFSGISPGEIEVLREQSGKPYVVLHGAAKQKAEELGIVQIHISISNTKEFALAYAVGESA